MDELGIPQERLQDSNVHVMADADHADLIWGAIARHIASERAYETALEGAKESLLVDRAVKAGWWYYMQSIED
jgi:hypothetical protein